MTSKTARRMRIARATADASQDAIAALDLAVQEVAHAARELAEEAEKEPTGYNVSDDAMDRLNEVLDLWSRASERLLRTEVRAAQ